MEVVTLSRIQFGLTIGFHYFYPPLSIGLGVMLVIIQAVWLKTKNPIYHQMAKFWTNIFALTFALGVAILRHQLWDIDLLISRTLVYGLLTSLLAAIYAASIAVLQLTVRAITGQTSDIVIVVSTLGTSAERMKILGLWLNHRAALRAIPGCRASRTAGERSDDESYCRKDEQTPRDPGGGHSPPTLTHRPPKDNGPGWSRTTARSFEGCRSVR